MLKQPDISPTLNRDNEDYGTKMMDYNDMSNNAL